MRIVSYGVACSLDGFIAGADGSIDWLHFSKDVQDIMSDYWKSIDLMVMGRKTWDVTQANMPKSKKKRKEVLPHGEMKTYVFSRTLEAGETEDGAIIVNDDPGEFVRNLKQQEGNEICIMGGGLLGRELLEAGVIDEVGFNIHPVLLGSGIPLFHEMKRQIDLELIESRQLKNGCVYVRYRVKN